MSSLGLALIGANSYFKADDERIQREREAERFQWEQRREGSAQQRDAADLSLIPDRVGAARSGYSLQTKQNTANAGLVDSQANNAGKRLALEDADLDAKAARQPTEARTADNNAEIARVVSEFSVGDLPRAIVEKKRQGIFSDADAFKASVVKLSELIQDDDNAYIIQFMNALKRLDPNNQKIPDVANVGVEKHPQTGENIFIAKSQDGQPVFMMNAKRMARIRDSVGKTDLKVVNAGDTLVGVKGGQATALYTAPDSAKSTAAGKQGESLFKRDVDYLMAEHGMTKEQALDVVRSGKIANRGEFVKKALSNIIALNKKPTDEDITYFNNLYEKIKKLESQEHQPATPGLGSNSPQPANMDPQIKSLIGIP